MPMRWVRLRSLACLALSTVLHVRVTEAEPRVAVPPRLAPTLSSFYSFRASDEEYARLVVGGAHCARALKFPLQFSTEILGSADSASWVVRFKSTQQMDLWHACLDLLSLRPVPIGPLDSLSAVLVPQREALHGLADKLAAVARLPGWEYAVRSGRVVKGDRLVVGPDTLSLVGRDALPVTTAGVDKVVVAGSEIAPGVFQCDQLRVVQAGRLDICIMSLCPFAQGTLARLCQLAVQGHADRVSLQVHYIFRKVAGIGGAMEFVSLHGNDELVEDALQITLRDHYPQYFEAYLLRRATSREPWQTLLLGCNASWHEIEDIRDRVGNDYESILAGEFETVTAQYGELAASPTFFWEGKEVEDLTSVIPGWDIAPAADKCLE